MVSTRQYWCTCRGPICVHVASQTWCWLPLSWLRSWTVGVSIGLLGALICPLPLIVARLVSGASQVGMGDIKLAFFIGLILGAPVALWSVLLSLVLSLLVGGIGMLQGRYTLRSKLPFGPFLAAGTLPLLLLSLVLP
jgi:prepilin signal peptidase PulO-like enzyme (type II secretory pathway)